MTTKGRDSTGDTKIITTVDKNKAQAHQSDAIEDLDEFDGTHDYHSPIDLGDDFHFDVDEEDEQLLDNIHSDLSDITRNDIDRMSPTWYQSVLSVLAPARNTKSTTPKKTPREATRPHQSDVPAADLEALNLPAIIKLTEEKHCELNQAIDRLLNALRSHATSLFSIRALSKNEVWEMNKMHGQLMEIVKNIMHLQALPISKLRAFQSLYQALNETYAGLGEQYADAVQVTLFQERWQDLVQPRINEVMHCIIEQIDAIDSVEIGPIDIEIEPDLAAEVPPVVNAASSSPTAAELTRQSIFKDSVGSKSSATNVTADENGNAHENQARAQKQNPKQNQEEESVSFNFTKNMGG